MLGDKEKISIHQAYYLVLTIIFSPTIRYVPSFAAKEAKQAAWLTPFASIIPLLILIAVFSSFYKTYKDKSFMDIICLIMGTWLGKILTFLYFIWVLSIHALFIRYYAERITGSTLPNVNMGLLILLMLILVAYILRSEIVIIARMNEIIFPLTVIIFILLVILASPEIKFSSLTPISRKDIFPVLRGSIGVTGVWIYIMLIFFFSDKINNKENLKKVGFQAILYLLASTVILLSVTIGTLGSSVTERIMLPFLGVVKQISVFKTLEKIESVIVALWIATDFILITVLAYVAVYLIKSFFHLSESKFLINIYLFFIFFLSLYICNSVFELQSYSQKIAGPINLIFGLAVPVLVFAVGKIRRKI